MTRLTVSRDYVKCSVIMIIHGRRMHSYWRNMHSFVAFVIFFNILWHLIFYDFP